MESPIITIRRVDEISLFVGKNPISGMLNHKDDLAAFLHSFANRRKHLPCAIIWLCFRWIKGKTFYVVYWLPRQPVPTTAVIGTH
jgi:hypothetical protein